VQTVIELEREIEDLLREKGEQVSSLDVLEIVRRVIRTVEEHLMRPWQKVLEEVRAERNLVREQIELHHRATEARFQVVDQRFESLLRSIEDLRKATETRFQAHDRRFEALERRLGFMMWFIGIFFTITNLLIVLLKIFG